MGWLWKSPEEKLLKAAEEGDAKRVAKMIRKGVDVNSTDVYGWTPLYWATNGGHAAIVKMLIDARADVNAQDPDGLTGLHMAAAKGHAAIVKMLIDARADLNVQDQDGLTPLYWASTRGHETVVKMLIDVRAELNVCNVYGSTPLHEASEIGQGAVAKILIDAEANLNAKDKDGLTPLHWASRSGHESIVKMLVDSGVDTSVKGKDGSSVMAVALQNSFQKSVETLSGIFRILVSHGVQWDNSCDDVLISRGEAVEEAHAIRVCVLWWADEYKEGIPLTDVPSENIKLGEQSTRTYLESLRASRPSSLVRRCKICVVAPSQWGKTSLVKSLTTLLPSLEHPEDRTIGIDLVKWGFETPSASADQAPLKHEVTFWDFAGQDAYQPAHSLFFTERTLFVLCINLEAYMTAVLQTALNAREEHHIGRLMLEFVDENVLQWVQLVFSRQPDAEFVLVATKGDRLERSLVRVDEMKEDFRLRMRSYVESIKKERSEYLARLELDQGSQERNETDGPGHRESGVSQITAGITRGTFKRNHDVSRVDRIVTCAEGIVSQQWLTLNCKSAESIQQTALSLQGVVVRSKRGYVMPELFTQVLEAVVAARAQTRLFTAFSELWIHLKRIVPRLRSEDECREVLHTLHALGDVLWWRDLAINHLQENLMIDPMVPIDYIRQVVTHKGNAECMPHNTLIGRSFWSSLNEVEVLTMKQLLHEFLLVYPAPLDDVHQSSGEMRLNSDLIVPAYWKSNTWAVWKFGGDQLHLPGAAATSKPAVRVLWQYRFRCHMPLTLFDQLAIASSNAMLRREIGPDWILYECGADFACRLVVCRHLETLERAFEIEAVASSNAQPHHWAIFKHLCRSLKRVLSWYRGLLVDCSAQDSSGSYHQLERVVGNWKWSPDLRPHSRAWLPPDLSWC